MRVAEDFIEKKFDQKQMKKIMSRDFRKLLNEEDDDSDRIMDDENELQDGKNEVDFGAKELLERKIRIERNKEDDWKSNWKINCEELSNLELPKTIIIWKRLQERSFEK